MKHIKAKLDRIINSAHDNGYKISHIGCYEHYQDAVHWIIRDHEGNEIIDFKTSELNIVKMDEIIKYLNKQKTNKQRSNIMRKTLTDAIYSAKYSNGRTHLNGFQINNMIKIFCKRCKPDTIAAFRERLMDLTSMTDFGIYNRVKLYSDNSVEYNVCQDETTELRTVRDCIVKNR